MQKQIAASACVSCPYTHRFKDHTTADHLRLAVEIVVMMFVIGYTCVEARKMWHTGVVNHILSYNLPHVLNIVLFYVSAFVHRRPVWRAAPRVTMNGGVVLYRYYRIRAYAALPSQVVASTDAYIPLREAVFYARTSKNINAFNAFLTWIKVFKYLHFIPRFRILLGTVEFAASKIGVFFVICAVVLFGSAQGFALAFGTNISAYRNLTQSFFTLTRSLLGYVRQTEEC